MKVHFMQKYIYKFKIFLKNIIYNLSINEDLKFRSKPGQDVKSEV